MVEKNKRIDLNDRETIAIGIVRKQPLKKIARLLGRHVTSISNEIRKHRICVSCNKAYILLFLLTNYPLYAFAKLL